MVGVFCEIIKSVPVTVCSGKAHSYTYVFDKNCTI